VNRRWGIDRLLESGERYARASKKPVMLEIPLLRDWNDREEDALALYERVRDRPFQINLIPFNAYAGSRFQAPPPVTVKRLQNVFVSRGITATVRASGGPDILAACGQLMRTAQS
jgi:23S rRNA (adenine2503-C2)-methyltransferase